MRTAEASAGPEPAVRPAGHWLLCRVADRLLALPLPCVVETMRPLPIRAFSGGAGFVLGVAVIRDAVVPVIGLDAVLGVPAASSTRFVTIRADDRILALAVDAVLGVRALDPAGLHEVPPLLGAVDRAALAAIGTLDSGLLLVLGDARLLPEAVWADLDRETEAGCSTEVPGSPGVTGSVTTA